MSTLAALSELDGAELERETALPDGFVHDFIPKGFEFVDGQLKELNVSAKSSRLAGEFLFHLAVFSRAHQPGWLFPSETTFQCFTKEPKRVRKPDVAFICLERYTEEQYDKQGHISVCPDLVVEVISPNDLAEDVNEKRREWLAAGATLVWIVDPREKTIHVYRTASNVVTLLSEADTLTGEPVLPGFACPLAELFRLPGR